MSPNVTRAGHDPATKPELMRCQCPNCGVHSMAVVGYHAAGACPNCGAYGLEAVSTEPLYLKPVWAR